MKKLKFYLLGILLIGFISCQEENKEFDLKKDLPVAPENIESIFESWAGKSSGRIASVYAGSAEVYEAYDDFEDKVLYGSLNPINSSQALLFTVENGEVSQSFLTKVSITDLGIETDVYTMDEQLILTFIDSPDGTRQIFSNMPSNGRTEGWWSEFDDCIGAFHNPSGCNICDYAFVAVADAATIGLYSLFSLPVCAGVATGRS
ncbi:MAG: hypothetical protein WBA74_27390 [Cyclobacteriaceae bacterium]